MRELPYVSLTGDVEGDYIVLERHAGGVLRIAPKRPEGRPRVVELKRTCTACPSQWEGTLEDGRVIYTRYRHGALSVGIGDDIDQAVHNGWTDDALYADYVGDGFDGYMHFEELRTHLYGLLDFPPDLIVENEQPGTGSHDGKA